MITTKKESSYKFLTVIVILIAILFFSGCAKSDLAGEAFKKKGKLKLLIEPLPIDNESSGNETEGTGCCFAQDNFCQDSLTAQECCGSEVFNPGVPCTQTQCEWMGCCLDSCQMMQYMDCGTDFTFINDLAPTYDCDSTPECAPEDIDGPFMNAIWIELDNGYKVLVQAWDCSGLDSIGGSFDGPGQGGSGEGHSCNGTYCSTSHTLEQGTGNYTIEASSIDIYNNTGYYTETRYFEAPESEDNESSGNETEQTDTDGPEISFSWFSYGNTTGANVTAEDSQSNMAWLNLSITPACNPSYSTNCVGNTCWGVASSNCGPVNYTITADACDVEGNCNDAYSVSP